ncbi:MAG: FAD-dependent oxidoreductase, partial [Anaerolineae bacterium]
MHTNSRQPPQTWKLSPSDLTFLWDECPRCFYLKVVHGFPRPRMPLPRIFLQIDALLTAYCQDKPTAHLVPDLPAGVVRHAQRWVTSQPIALPGSEFQEGGRVMDSTGALALADIPNRLLVVGAGFVGLELGSVYAALGSRVT